MKDSFTPALAFFSIALVFFSCGLPIRPHPELNLSDEIELCGLLDEPCCSENNCDSIDLTCYDGTCVMCGFIDAPCCPGEDRDGDLCFYDGYNGGYCQNKLCKSCGGLDQKCCPDDTCYSGGCLNNVCMECGLLNKPCCINELDECMAGRCIENVCSLGKTVEEDGTTTLDL